MSEEQAPEGWTKQDDGCFCPPKSAPPECEDKLETCPYDPRYPNQNQTKRCYKSFVDYQKCARLLGDYPGCIYFLKCYRSLCPNAWVNKWFDQMDRGIFPRKIYPPKPIIRPPEGRAATCNADINEEEPPADVC